MRVWFQTHTTRGSEERRKTPLTGVHFFRTTNNKANDERPNDALTHKQAVGPFRMVFIIMYLFLASLGVVVVVIVITLG